MRNIIASILILQLLLVPSTLFMTETKVKAANINESDMYTVISNESTDVFSMETTGSFDIKNMNYTTDESLEPDAYEMDVNKPFKHSSNKGKVIQRSTLSITNSYNVGDNKYFWVTNFITNTDYQIQARLAYSGTKANVWVYNNQITDLDAQKLGKEFDEGIYPSVTNSFGNESDINRDGKINILSYDIQDGFTGDGGYIAGYFWAGDLYNVSGSNQSEIFYVDSYPSMGISKTKDVTKAYSTLAHEFQHMVNFNRNVLVEGGTNMDTWLDEALAMAAEEIYSGQGLSDRIDYYNSSSSIRNGHSLLYWDYDGDVLSNYSLSYLFGQYIKIQTNQGDRIFKEILADPNNDYKAIENVAKKYISPDMTFGKLMTNFRIALLLKEQTGLYGFKGAPFFDALEEQIYTGGAANLRGGGSVVKTYNSSVGFVEPEEKGENITFVNLAKDRNIARESEISFRSLIGSTRFTTAVEVSKQGWNTADTVLLSNGNAIVDGLTATPLAAAKDAPLLLTTKDLLPLDTLNEIKRLGAKDIILIGGIGAISGEVENELKSEGFNVIRIGGKNRYETSLMIAQELDKLVDVSTVYTAYGFAEPDALSIAAQAGKQKQPIVLTDKDALPEATFDWLKGEGLSDAYFIGGQGVITSSVVEQVNGVTSQSVLGNRISGSNRLETNARIIEKFYPESELPTIMVAKSETKVLVDALTAGPLAAKLGVPVLLVSQQGFGQLQKDVLAGKQVGSVYQVGGGISQAVLEDVLR